jgi:Cys-rich repeat protein
VFESEVEGGLQRCTNGLIHRPTALSCPSLLPLPDPVLPGVDDIPDASYSFNCRRDGDCTEHPYGHCSTEPAVPHCEYGCALDADCATAQLCSCQSYGGRCVPATCRSDGECGSRLCGSYTGCSGTQFVCQTALDQCAADSDCPTGQVCTIEPSDNSNPNSFLRRVCRERFSCAQ